MAITLISTPKERLLDQGIPLKYLHLEERRMDMVLDIKYHLLVTGDQRLVERKLFLDSFQKKRASNNFSQLHVTDATA